MADTRLVWMSSSFVATLFRVIDGDGSTVDDVGEGGAVNALRLQFLRGVDFHGADFSAANLRRFYGRLMRPNGCNCRLAAISCAPGLPREEFGQRLCFSSSHETVIS